MPTGGSGRERRIFVMTGDGELQEGQIWESLVSAANHRLGNITVIVDHNKLQSDIWVKETSDLGDLEAKFAAFGWHVARCDGHDLRCVRRDASTQLRSVADRPKVIIADTVKGKGVSFMELSALAPDDKLYRYHSGAPSPDDYRRAADELIERANSALGRHRRANRCACEGTAADPRRPLRAPERLIPAYTEALIAARRNVTSASSRSTAIWCSIPA